jgi:hypothetical protein
MRTLMKVSVPVEAGNKAVRDGTIAQVIQATVERVKPEAVYFTEEQGQRCAFFVFDLKDPTDMPAISEPLYQALNASVTYSPVMTAQDLQVGLTKIKL